MLYNLDSKDSVQDVVLECFCPLVENIVDEYYILREDENLALFLPAYMGKELVEMLLEDDLDLWVHEESEMNLLNEDTDILISIFDDGMLFVEEAKGLNGKFKRSPDSVLVNFYDGYPHKSLRDIDEDTKILCFGFIDKFEDEYDEEGILDLITDENDDVVGFRAYRETDEGFVGYECIRNYSMDEDDIYETLRKVGLI